MRGRSGAITERVAHLLDRLLVEPTLQNPLLDCPAVGASLAAADVVVSALVVEDEKANGVGLSVEQIRIENDNTWCGRAEIRQTRIEHVARASAAEGAAGDQQLAVTPQVNGRRQPRQVDFPACQLSRALQVD